MSCDLFVVIVVVNNNGCCFCCCCCCSDSLNEFSIKNDGTTLDNSVIDGYWWCEENIEENDGFDDSAWINRHNTSSPPARWWACGWYSANDGIYLQDVGLAPGCAAEGRIANWFKCQICKRNAIKKNINDTPHVKNKRIDRDIRQANGIHWKYIINNTRWITIFV